MKRMVLIPEERLIRYEKQLDGPTNEQAGGSTYSPFIILVGIILDMIIYIITRSILAR